MIFYGTRTYGKLKAGDGLAVATMFFHIFWLPLVPYRGLITLGGNNAVKSRLRLQSVARGYAQAWGPLVALVGTGVSMAAGASMAIGIAVALVGLLAAIWAWAPHFTHLGSGEAQQVHDELRQLAASQSTPTPGTPQDGPTPEV